MSTLLVFKKADGSGHLSDLTEEAIRLRCQFYNCDETEIQKIIEFANTASIGDIYKMKHEKDVTVYKYNLP